MIVVTNGMVSIGDVTMPRMMAEFTEVIKSVYEVLIENGYSDDFARETIAHAGRLAFMTDEEVTKDVQEKTKELEDFIKAIKDDKE